jgi:hypothetical protein
VKMAEGENGRNAIRVDPDALDFTITIHHNIVAGTFEVTGWKQNEVVSLGMLKYANHLVEREIGRREMAEEMQRMRLAAPGARFPR